MHNVIYYISRFRMSRRPACLEASSLVDRYIDQNCTGFHLFYMLCRHQFRCSSASDEDSANNQVRFLNQRINGMFCRVFCSYAPPVNMVYLA